MIDNCVWTIRNGWYKGTDIHYIASNDKDECAAACCAHPHCGTWTLRTSDNNCILKQGNDLTFMTGEGHYTAIETGSKRAS